MNETRTGASIATAQLVSPEVRAGEVINNARAALMQHKEAIGEKMFEGLLAESDRFLGNYPDELLTVDEDTETGNLVMTQKNHLGKREIRIAGAKVMVNFNHGRKLSVILSTGDDGKVIKGVYVEDLNMARPTDWSQLKREEELIIKLLGEDNRLVGPSPAFNWSRGSSSYVRRRSNVSEKVGMTQMGYTREVTVTQIKSKGEVSGNALVLFELCKARSTEWPDGDYTVHKSTDRWKHDAPKMESMFVPQAKDFPNEVVTEVDMTNFGRQYWE